MITEYDPDLFAVAHYASQPTSDLHTNWKPTSGASYVRYEIRLSTNQVDIIRHRFSPMSRREKAEGAELLNGHFDTEQLIRVFQGRGSAADQDDLVQVLLSHDLEKYESNWSISPDDNTAPGRVPIKDSTEWKQLLTKSRRRIRKIAEWNI